MSTDDFDKNLIRAYGFTTHENPPLALDNKILRAAEAHAKKQRTRLYLIPFAAAAALVLSMISSFGWRESTEPKSPNAVIPDEVTLELLRIRQPVATSSAITNHVLNLDEILTFETDADGPAH